MTFRLWDRIRDWVILAVLLITSLLVLLARNGPVLRSLRALSLELTGRVEAQFSMVGNLLRALEENSTLRRDNIELSSQVALLREAQLENQSLREMLAFRDRNAYPLKATRIVAKDITGQQNLLTIDVGRADSIRIDMPVIDHRGVIGKVVLVGENFSLVQPYLNTEFRISAEVQPLQAVGIVRWDGKQLDRLLMEFVVKTEPVEPGMRVVTSGDSQIYPPGFTIGTVDSVRTLPGQNQWEIFVAPVASLSTARHAFVLLNETNPEREAVSRSTAR